MSASVLKFGTRVVITDGLARDKVGKVQERAGWEWEPGVPVYLVELDEGLRVIRADFLRPVEEAS